MKAQIRLPILVSILAPLIMLSNGCGPSTQNTPNLDASQANGRLDIRKAIVDVKGKNVNSVRAILGSPVKQGRTSYDETWTYINRFFDPATGNQINEVDVEFDSEGNCKGIR